MLIVFKDAIPPKKNSKRIIIKKKSKTILPSDKYLKWNKYMKQHINDMVFFSNTGELNNVYHYAEKEKLQMKAIFFKQNNRDFDLTNIIQSIEDTFSDLWIIKDDKYKVLSSFSYFISGDILKKDVSVIVEILPMLDDSKILDVDYINNINFENIINLYKENNFEKIENFKYVSPKTLNKTKKKKKVFFEPKIF